MNRRMTGFMASLLKRFRIGVDFSEEDFKKWQGQIEWWIRETMPKVEDPVAHAKKVLLASMNGTKINGEAWPRISHDFYNRVKLLAGFDLRAGVGFNRGRGKSKKDAAGQEILVPTSKYTAEKIGTPSAPRIRMEDLPEVKMEDIVKQQEEYKQSLLDKYPHLENLVYKPKVDELAETVVKSRMLSTEFVLATGTALEKLSKIRESLHKQIKELMDFLEISPQFMVRKQKESEKADVGSLVATLESYGSVWQEFERMYALMELIQKYKQLNTIRPDGTPQLNDWELWHQTRNRPVNFTCRCGESYKLLGGFTIEEIEKALEQAYKVYGFGLELLEGADYLPPKKMDDSMLEGTFSIDDIDLFDKEEDEDNTASGDGLSA